MVEKKGPEPPEGSHANTDVELLPGERGANIDQNRYVPLVAPEIDDEVVYFEGGLKIGTEPKPARLIDVSNDATQVEIQYTDEDGNPVRTWVPFEECFADRQARAEQEA